MRAADEWMPKAVEMAQAGERIGVIAHAVGYSAVHVNRTMARYGYGAAWRAQFLAPTHHRPPPKWLPEAERMLAEGKTRSDVAGALGLSMSRVCDVLRLAGHPVVRRPKAASVEAAQAAGVRGIPRGRARLCPLRSLTDEEREMVRAGAPEAAMYAAMQRVGVPL